MSKNLKTLFEVKNVNYTTLIQGLEKDKKINNVVDYGIVDKATEHEFLNEKEQTQFYSYVAYYGGESFLIDEVIKLENGKVKEYISFKISQA